jgi:hypothetical protein
MPDSKTIEKAEEDKREGKSASTQAGEFVKAEIDKVRLGKHEARSPKQAIAIGLSEARRAGIDLPAPGKGKTKKSTRKSAKYAYEAGQHRHKMTRRPQGLAGSFQCPETGTEEHRVAQGALKPGQAGKFPPFRRVPFASSQEGRQNQRDC